MTDATQLCRELENDDPLILTATEWLIRLRDEDVDPQVISDWECWLAASAHHRRAFVQVQTVWEAVGQSEALPWPTDAEVFNDGYAAEESVATWRNAADDTQVRPTGIARRMRVRAAGRPLTAAAAGILMALAVGVVWRATNGPRPATLAADNAMETGTAEHKSFSLPDGSTVFLGGATRVTVVMTPERRSLRLDRGEAFFEVAHDPARPFVVRAGSAEVTAVGTAFDVRRSADGVLVAVTHGAVKLDTLDLAEVTDGSGARQTRLHAGQAAELSQAGWSSLVAANVPAMTAWREGRLQYSSEPLRVVVAELTRYSSVPVELADPGVGDVRVTATVFEGDVHGWLEGLEQALPVKVDFGKDRIVISKRETKDP
jgi:transmembrane sensor